MKHSYCNCNDCKKARRKGKILGGRIEGYFSQGVFGWCSVSDYVPFRKFQKGRARKERNMEMLDA